MSAPAITMCGHMSAITRLCASQTALPRLLSTMRSTMSMTSIHALAVNRRHVSKSTVFPSARVVVVAVDPKLLDETTMRGAMESTHVCEPSKASTMHRPPKTRAPMTWTRSVVEVFASRSHAPSPFRTALLCSACKHWQLSQNALQSVMETCR